jgi:uncharacterized protein (DUF58 family)
VAVAADTQVAFPLIPRRRLTGLPFGQARSARRGRGSDIVGTRAYQHGDPISTIDWRASARLSSVRGEDAFLVTERRAEESPRVMILYDRSPSMGLYPPPFPWLRKPQAAWTAIAAIVYSTMVVRGAAGYMDCAGADERDGEPYWLPPRTRSLLPEIGDRQSAASFDASPGALADGIDFLARLRRGFSAGTFLFVISDFLEPLPDEAWLPVRARFWEVVPVVLQDPTWEQSFPLLGPLVVPFADPGDGQIREVRMRRRESVQRRELHERRRAELLERFELLDLDPVLVSTADPLDVGGAFLEWADRRRPGGGLR